MPSLGSILRRILIVVIAIAAIVIAYFLAIQFVPTAATISPSVSAIDVGQTIYVGVGWKGGLAPYTVVLYGNAVGPCNSTSPIVGVKSDLLQPQFIFTVSPSSTINYCGMVTSTTAESAVSVSTTVTVNPTLGPPTLAFSPPAVDRGQSGTVVGTVKLNGGSAPFTVTLYSGTSSTCATDTTVVPASPGSNPVTQLFGDTARFSFAAPTSATYYCASVKDSTPASTTTSSVVELLINPDLEASISPTQPKVDAGQSLLLTAEASDGTPPYTYQWYYGPTCGSPITGQTNSTFSTGVLTAGTQYSVLVGDSSTGAPPAGLCAKTSVAFNSAFNGTSVAISASQVVDDGQTVTLLVSWQSAGSSPYNVFLTTSATDSCSSPAATGINATKVPGTSTSFQVTPSLTTFYCATVTDSATVPESVYTSIAAELSVAPTLSPSIVLSPAAIDAGQTAPLTATVELSGGTAPYTVTLYGGFSATCSGDTAVVVSSGPNPQTGLQGPTAVFSMPAPSLSTYYCAKVTDSATTPVTATSPATEFVVNPILSAMIAPPSPVVVAGKSISLTAQPSVGVAPYTYAWYSGLGCHGSPIPGQTSQMFVTPELLKAANYSVLVGDSSVGKPAQTFCASTTVLVVPALVPILTLSPQGMDLGQTVTIKATVSWKGGTPPFSVALFSGSSSTCSSDTTSVVSTGPNPVTPVSGYSTVFTLPGPTANTYYCAKVTDSTTTPQIVFTPVVEFLVSSPPKTATIVISPTTLDSGQSSTVVANVSWTGGAIPFKVTLYSGSSASCSSDTVIVGVSGQNPQTAVTTSPVSFTFPAPGSTTYYCAAVTDGGSPPTTIYSPTARLRVSADLLLNAPVLSPMALDSGQSVGVTITVSWLGGSAPFTVTLYSGFGSTCAYDSTVVDVISGSNPQTGINGSSATFIFASPNTSTDYCFSVKDTSATSATVFSPTAMFSLNPALFATLGPLSPSAIDAGQTVVATATVTWSGGTPPYSVSLFSGLTTNCQTDTAATGTSKGSLLTSSAAITFTPSPITTYYCAKVTDSSGVPFTILTATQIFTINVVPTVTISPSTPTTMVSGGQAPPLTATASGGTPPYTYQWFTGSSCAASISGQTAATYMPGVLAVTSTFSVEVIDSSTGSPANLGTACATVQVPVGSGPEGIASDPLTGMVYVVDPQSNHISVINSYTEAVVATIPVGTLPWGVTVDDTNNLVYVTNYGSGTVSIIDGITDTACAPPRCAFSTVTVGQSPEGIGLNVLLNQAYVANSAANTVSVINTTSDKVIATVAVGSDPRDVAVGAPPPRSPPGTPPKAVFVTDYGSNTVSVISLVTPYTSYPVTTVTVGSNPWGVAANPFTNLVYVASAGPPGTVTVINGSTFTTLGTISLGSAVTPGDIAVDSATATLYITDTSTNTVSAVNLITNTVITSTSPQIPIPAGNGPWGITVLLNPGNPAYTNLGFVTNSLTDTVSVINLATNQFIASIIVS